MSLPDRNNTSDPTTKPDGRAETTPPAAERGPRSLRRRVLRRGLRALGWLTGGLIVGMLLLLLVVQTRSGSQWVGETIIALVNPFEDAAIDIGHIGGNWISTLELHDINVTRADTVRLVHVDTLRLRYRLLSLLRKRLHVRQLYLAGPKVALQQQDDATWDLLNALGPTEPDTTTAPSNFVMLVDDLRLDDGGLSVRFYAPGKDSTLRERRNPNIIKGSRRRRIAAGAGQSVSEVNSLLKEFRQMQTMMQKFGKGMMSGMNPFA